MNDSGLTEEDEAILGKVTRSSRPLEPFDAQDIAEATSVVDDFMAMAEQRSEFTFEEAIRCLRDAAIAMLVADGPEMLTYAFDVAIFTGVLYGRGLEREGQ